MNRGVWRISDQLKIASARRAWPIRFFHEHFQLVFAECSVFSLGRLVLSHRVGNPAGVELNGCAVPRSYRIYGYLGFGVVERNIRSIGVAHLAWFFADGAVV